MNDIGQAFAKSLSSFAPPSHKIRDARFREDKLCFMNLVTT